MAFKKEEIMVKTTKRRPSAVVFELEYVGASGRQVVFDALRSVLDKKGITLTAEQFAHLCTEKYPQDYVGALLKNAGKERFSDEKAIEEVKAAIAAGFAKPGLKAAPGLKKILTAAAAQGMAVGCVGSLEKDAMQELVVALGLGEPGVTMLSNAGGRLSVPGVESWMKIARMTGAHPSRCLALASSSSSCRAAVRTHMHCVAVTDRFTECADFSGVDFCVKSLDDLVPAEAFASIETGL